jgi:hypothetical protein
MNECMNEPSTPKSRTVHFGKKWFAQPVGYVKAMG